MCLLELLKSDLLLCSSYGENVFPVLFSIILWILLQFVSVLTNITSVKVQVGRGSITITVENVPKSPHLFIICIVNMNIAVIFFGQSTSSVILNIIIREAGKCSTCNPPPSLKNGFSSASTSRGLVA